MRRQHDLDEMTDAAWRAFRGRLADHVAVMDDDDVLVVEYADATDDVDGEDEDGDGDGGSLPYVQLCAFGDGLVQAEAVGNVFLHPSHALDAAQETRLVSLGLDAPLDEPGWENFHQTFERRDADRVAFVLVAALREVYGVPHPSFLAAEGLEVDPTAPTRRVAEQPEPASGDDPAVFPQGPEHLQALVDGALRELFPDLQHDEEGDIPIVTGQSIVFVRVRHDRPAVEIFAEVVVDPDDLGRLAGEIVLLDGAHPLWKFSARDGGVMMRHELMAVPFCAVQLRILVRQFVDEIEQIAGDLVARVGGRRFLDPEPVDTEEDPWALVMTGLLELLHLGTVRAATVAGLFDHERLEIIRQIVRVRTGHQSCGDHDPELVLTALRKGLRLVSDAGPEPRVPLPPRPATPHSVQPSLLSDADAGEDCLDLGWSA